MHDGRVFTDRIRAAKRPNRWAFIASAAALAVIYGSSATPGHAQAITSMPAANGMPGWHLQDSFPDPTGHTIVDAGGHVTVIPPAERPKRVRYNDPASAPPGAAVPPCRGAPICGNRMGGIGPKRHSELRRVTWDQTLGYTYTFPYTLPKGIGGVPAVGRDSKGNLWAYKRSPAGTPQLYKFDANHKLILSVGDDVLGHAFKAHGLAVDAEDNVWLTDTARAIAQKVSPDGKLLMTIGEAGHRGDWDEAKGQRLLWEPVMIAFAPNGDIYIAEGHGNESPNDTDSDDPTNRSGASRIIHLDRTGKFINQWYGNNPGPGKFTMAHGIAIDPANGDVWIGDREQYRIVVFTANGEYIKSIQTKNLVCALTFDSQGQLWMGSGQDGQFLKLDRDGNVIGAVGTGMGIDPGEFIEASYFVFDENQNLYTGDTSVGRITKMIAPGNP